MALAVTIADYARGYSSPNPPVGAVVLDATQRLVGLGITQPPGGNHAEIEALREAGENARGGSVYVTLEPCSSQGRTGSLFSCFAGGWYQKSLLRSFGQHCGRRGCRISSHPRDHSCSNARRGAI